MATAKLFLDTRYSSKDGETPASVKIAINHKGKSAAITTEVKVLPSQWDKTTCRVKEHAQKNLYNRTLLGQLSAVTNILAEMVVNEDAAGMTASDLCKKVREYLMPEQVKPAPAPEPKENPNTVEKFFTRYCEAKDLRERTIAMYDTTWRRIQAWLGVKKASALEFKDINLAWIEEFDKFLAVDAPNLNGRRGHHANLKAVINYAMDHEVTEKNPYRRFKIKTQATAKRNMSVEQLRYIIFAQDLEPWMERHRDFFVLSFMLRGLNTVDLCHLTKPVQGRVEWMRTKTNQPLSLKIEPEMQMLIDKHAGKDLMLEMAEGRDYRNYNLKLSKGLKAIRETINARLRKAGEPELPDFTMYWARHTWATIAQRLGFAIDVVGEGLGHSQKSVTEIYIERDPAEVDRVNRAVLDYVLYGIDYRNPKVTAPAPKKRGRPRKIA